ncbi:MAG: putative Ig domain-containing protein [Flavobacteriales bacterium]|nr:putative Ig domain-containing protein [Flavobacteriales bacterium]
MPDGGSFECSTCAGGIDSDGTIDLSVIGVGTHAISYMNACTAPDSISTTITVTAPASATINYPTAPLCSTEGPATVDVIGSSGGTFSSPTGLVFIDQATGEVDPSSSPAATHTVIYTLPAAGGCAAFTTSTTVQVVAGSLSVIDYTDSIYCNISAVVPVMNTTATPGNYTHIPSGLDLNSTTGTITLGTASQAGIYDITFTLPANAACPAFSASDRVVIIARERRGDTAIALCTTSPT